MKMKRRRWWRFSELGLGPAKKVDGMENGNFGPAYGPEGTDSMSY